MRIWGVIPVFAVACGGGSGSDWKPAPSTPNLFAAIDVWAFSPTDVWVVDGSSTVQRFDGDGWLITTVTEAPSIDCELFDGPPLQGAELCEADTSNCATSDAAGVAQIMVPANQEVTYTISKDGFAPYVIGDVSEPPSIGATWPMISDSLMTAEGERVGFAWPTDDGLLPLAAFPLQAGVTWVVDDETATVYYMDEACLAQTDLTATTSIGRGGFYDVSVGVREVDFGGAASNCTPGIAWPGTAANQIRVPVRAGHFGYGSMECDPP